jgi:DNA adenine methylase
MGKLTQPIKYPGGKHYLAKRIVELLPSTYINYVEPFAGGLSVLLEKAPVGAEIVNDLDLELSNFWSVLSDAESFGTFRRIVEATPFSETFYDAAVECYEELEDSVDQAVAFFVRARQSRAGQMRSFATLTKNRTRRGMQEQVASWLTAVKGLPAVHDRLKRVLILHRDALDVIREFDAPETVVYADPPYHLSTRATKKLYEREMSDEQHLAFLSTIKAFSGKVLVSGYRCELYDTELSTWRRVDFDLPLNMAGGKAKRRAIESVWLNF